MNPLTNSAFDLPDRLCPKADPTLIAGDDQHFAAIAERLDQVSADVSDRLDAERRAPGGTGRRALDRDQEIRRLTAKGLEFDLVVLINPAAFGTGIEGAVDRYVAMTRATQQLAILTAPDNMIAA